MEELQNYKSACFTGYRPEKFQFNLNNEDVDFQIMKSRILKTLLALIEDDCKVFYCGMARGFDIVCAECVLEFKEKFDIKLIAAIPYGQQEISFDYFWRTKYYKILQQCDEAVYLSDKYHKSCFQERNQYMVDNSDYVVCWFDGKNGGTYNTIAYAQKKNRVIINLNTDYCYELNNIQTEINLF